ncbi:MAG: DUF4177 domain-containing protein [Tropicimonas sp.]|uniref:DUF4177 domain-containing protein n=1 Tax=Tropicimonas sp. TaxID=2067044 RepID=UPI003A87C2E9
MPTYEYKVVPAPERGMKVKGMKTPQDRFAMALQTVMNDLGAQGWEYVRAETLPSEERSGLTGTTTAYQNMLVFRREAGQDHATRPAEPAAAPMPAAAPVTQVPAAAVAPAAPRIAPVIEPETAARAMVPPPPAPPPAPRSTERLATDVAAAAAAAAALTAYRKAGPNVPKLGPAPERRPDPEPPTE